jgi:hypothetical protein
MSGNVSEARHETDRPGDVSPATILFGVILLMLGVLWLLDIGDIIDVTWTLVGSVTLILIGIMLIVTARRDSPEGMIFLGIVLSAVVLLGSLASWPSFEGGVGENDIAPASFEQVEAEYSWAVGSQEIDFSDVSFPEGATSVELRLGTGNIQVIIPDDVAVRVDWSIGLGNADVFDENRSGVNPGGSYQSEGFDSAETQLEIDVSLGMGSLEVRR